MVDELWTSIEGMGLRFKNSRWSITMDGDDVYIYIYTVYGDDGEKLADSDLSCKRDGATRPSGLLHLASLFATPSILAAQVDSYEFLPGQLS